MRATALSMKNDFKKARRNLVLLYLLIVGCIIGIFSALIVYQAQDSFSDPAVPTGANTRLSATDAQSIAQNLRPGKEIEETEYEIEDGALYFTTAFDDDDEIKVDLLSGNVLTPEPEGSWRETLTDDFDEQVIWIALIIFALSTLFSVYTANKTLAPILRNMETHKQFIAGAAHELRNPLAALHARIESVLRSPTDELKEDVLTDLLLETQHLIGISEGLLALENGEHRKRHIRPLVVRDTIEQVTGRLSHLAANTGITIETRATMDTLEIDEEDLETIVYNLLHNAIKFTGSGGAILITWESNTLTVKDSGIGITPEDIPHIFNRFHKGDVSRGSAGSGLGLSLVSDLAEHYKASIETSSQVGNGTIIRIIF